jgi:serine/threonine protein kinase
MISSANNITRNNVPNRFLPIPETVLKGLESEPKISDFILIKELGIGSFGRVLLVQHKITQAMYAIKAIDKRNTANIQEKPYFRREIEIMYRVHHPNVVKLFGHFEDANYCYFIMEYIPGGNVYNLVPKNGYRTVSTKTIVSIMKDVICATYFLHHMHPPIIHRDIKPENVVLDKNMVAKLTDFGWSNYVPGDYSKRTTVCGTPIYLAPEIINNQGHDEKVDIWCIGVLMFELMVGSSPFQGNDVNTVKYNIRMLNIKWPTKMDRDAADLISRILKYNPEERISLEQMLLHPFFTKYYPNAISCLKKPDNTQYKVFIVSKDNPLTWNPVYTGNEYTNDYGVQINRSQNDYNKVNNTKNINQYDYNSLLQKYDNLKREYNDLRKAGFSAADLDSLRRELKEKEDKINQLSKSNRVNSYNYQNNVLRATYNELKNENYDLKNQLSLYESHYNNQNNVIYLDNNFNEIRNSISQNNKDGFNQAFEQLKTNIDNYTQNDYNTIIMMKDREIEKWKEGERLRREREKQEFKNLINSYDQTLSMQERENQELKMRLKELEGYFV